MSRMTTPHMEDFDLLRFTTEDMDDVTRHRARRHVEACALCAGVLREMEELDRQMAEVLRRSQACAELGAEELSADDPFKVRPEMDPRPRRKRIPHERLESLFVASSRVSIGERDRILQAAAEPGMIRPFVAELALSDTLDRLALLYALQEAGLRIAADPLRALLFAEAVLDRARHGSHKVPKNDEAEAVIPFLLLRAQAHLLAGQACNWTGEFEKARVHLKRSYRSFGRISPDETAMASVELNESQRRSFTGRAYEGLLLARRAAATFEMYEMRDTLARALSAEALALSALGEYEQALEPLRGAIKLFAEHALWSNYVGAVNNIGTCLVKLGRLDEARREFARALRRISRETETSWTGMIRDGLAQVLFSARRFREAAVSFAQAKELYLKSGMLSNALVASLFEIESWARQGDLARARRRLEIFQADVANRPALDPSLSKKIEEAFLGSDPDLEKIAELRQHAEEMFRERLRASA